MKSKTRIDDPLCCPALLKTFDAPVVSIKGRKRGVPPPYGSIVRLRRWIALGDKQTSTAAAVCMIAKNPTVLHRGNRGTAGVEAL